MWYDLEINWTLYAFFIAILIIVLISPRIERFKVKELEIEMLSLPPPEFVLSPATMESKLMTLETRPKR